MKMCNKFAFTLIEMITIIGIIIILGSITLTGVMKAKKYSQKMTCINNLKSLYSISLLYFQDYNYLPINDFINNISNKNDVFICPSKKPPNNKLFVNNNTVQEINSKNQFIEVEFTKNSIIFSDVDVESIIANPINAESIYPPPHDSTALIILKSGKLKEFTISEIISYSNE